MTARRRNRFNIKKYLTTKNLLIAGGALVVVVVLILVLVLNQSVYTAKQGSIAFEYDTNGAIIRSEKLYKTDVSSKTKLISEEGARVAKGDIIAEVYTADYSTTIASDLNNCEKKILDYLRNNLLKDVLNQDLDAIDEQIEEVSSKIRASIINNDNSSMTDLYTELLTLMNSRQEFLRSQVNEDANLAALYEEEAALMAQIESWTKYSIAEEDGVVSYYFDGAEASLTPDNMQELTADEILDILGGKSYYTLAAEENAIPLYRLVKPDEWYVAIVSNERIAEFENSEVAFNVEFTKGVGEQFSAKVIAFKEDGGKWIYYLRFTDYNTNLLTPRYIELTVKNEYNGLIVPDEAVHTVDEKTGIYVNMGGEKTFVEVDVLISKDGEACVQPTDITVQLGDECEVYV